MGSISTKYLVAVDSNNIDFWLDKWIFSGTSLISITNQASINTTLAVRDVVTASKDQNYNFLTSNLPHAFAFQVFSILAPKDKNGHDKIGYGGTNTKKFTTQNSCASMNARAQPIEGDWKPY